MKTFKINWNDCTSLQQKTCSLFENLTETIRLKQKSKGVKHAKLFIFEYN